MSPKSSWEGIHILLECCFFGRESSDLPCQCATDISYRRVSYRRAIPSIGRMGIIDTQESEVAARGMCVIETNLGAIPVIPKFRLRTSLFY